MSGTNLPMKLAITPVINTEEDWRPTVTVKKGPVATNIVANEASSVTDSSMLFQGIIPPNDMTCIRRNLDIEYEVIVGVRGLPFTLNGVFSMNAGRLVGQPDLCVPLPSPIYYNGQRWRRPGDFLGTEEGFTDFPGWNDFWCYQPGLALRPLPLQTNCSSIVLTINGTSITYPARDVSCLLPFLNWVDFSKNRLSTVPFYPYEGPFFREPKVGTATWTAKTSAVAPIPPEVWVEVPGTSTYNMDNGLDPFGGEMLYFSENSQMWQTGGRSVEWELLNLTSAPGEAFTYNGAAAANSVTTTLFDVVLKARVRESIPIGPFKLDDAFRETGLTRVNNLSLQLNYDNPVKMLACSTQLGAAWARDAQVVTTAANPPKNVAPMWGTAYDVHASLVSLNYGVGAAAVTYSCQKPVLRLEYNTADPITQARSPNFAILPLETYQIYKTANLFSVPTLQYPYPVKTIRAMPMPIYTSTLPAIRSTFIPSKLILYLNPDPSFVPNSIIPGLLEEEMDTSWYPLVYGTIGGAGGVANTNFSQSLVTSKMSNHFARIHSISVNVFNKVAVCSTWNEKELHQRSVQNGYKGSYEQWVGAWGSIVILDFANDLGLDVAMAPGQNTNCNIQVTISYSASSWYRSIGLNTENYWLGKEVDNGMIMPYEQGISYQAVQILLNNGSCIVGAGQMTVSQEGPAESQVLRLLQLPQRRQKTTDIPEELTAGSLGHDRVLSSDDTPATAAAPTDDSQAPDQYDFPFQGEDNVDGSGLRRRRRRL